MPNFNLADILSGIGDINATTAQDRNTAQQAFQQNQKLRDDSIAALIEASNLSKQVDAMDMQQQLTLEQRKKAAGTVFQTDLLDPRNRIAVLAREQAAAQDEAIANANEASRLSGINLFDSPLEYFVTRPFAGQFEERAAAASKRAAFIDKAIMDLNQQTQATVQTQAALNEQLTSAEVEARARLTQLKAEDAIRTAQIGRNDALLNDVAKLRSYDKEQLNWSIEAYKLRRHEEEFNARMEEMRAAREARKAAKSKEMEDINYAMQRYNMGAKALGRAPAASVDDFHTMLKYNRKAVMEIAEFGEQTWVDPKNPAAEISQVASTPGKAQVTLEYFKGSLPSSAAKVKGLLQETSALVHDELRKTQTGKITPDDLANALNAKLLGKEVKNEKGKVVEKVNGIIPQMLDNVEQDFGRADNIYKAPPVGAMAQIVPQLAETPAWKEIVAPASVTSQTPTVDSMLKHARIAVAEKRLTPEDAASFISAYHGAALQFNGSAEGYLRVGIPPATRYNVQVSTNGIFGTSTKKIDASSKQEVLNVIMRDSVSRGKQQREMLPAYNIFGF